MRKRHGIEYSEAVHGYSETFQEVLMYGLKTDKDPDVETQDAAGDGIVKHEDPAEMHENETEATDDETEVAVVLMNNDEIIEYPELAVDDL
jgi:hypothetical protein